MHLIFYNICDSCVIFYCCIIILNRTRRLHGRRASSSVHAINFCLRGSKLRCKQIRHCTEYALACALSHSGVSGRANFFTSRFNLIISSFYSRMFQHNSHLHERSFPLNSKYLDLASSNPTRRVSSQMACPINAPASISVISSSSSINFKAALSAADGRPSGLLAGFIERTE